MSRIDFPSFSEAICVSSSCKIFTYETPKPDSLLYLVHKFCRTFFCRAFFAGAFFSGAFFSRAFFTGEFVQELLLNFANENSQKKGKWSALKVSYHACKPLRLLSFWRPTSMGEIHGE